MERMAGKVAGDGRSHRSIDRSRVNTVYAYPGKLTAWARSLVFRIVNSSSFVSWLLSSTLQVTLTMVVHCQASDGCSKLCGFDHTPRSRDVQKFD